MPYGDRWDPSGWRQFVIDSMDYQAGLSGLEPANPWKISTPAYEAGLSNGGYAARAMRDLPKSSDFSNISLDWKKKY